jgi:hypothetical protein
MTNEEKYKTAEERKRWFCAFCSAHICAACKCNTEFISHPKENSKCAFRWLTLEYEEELKPCPFCDGEARQHKVNNIHFVYCINCGARTADSVTEIGASFIWNRRGHKWN